MAVDLQTFEPTYRLTERGAQVVSRLKTLVSGTNCNSRKETAPEKTDETVCVPQRKRHGKTTSRIAYTVSVLATAHSAPGRVSPR
jgi:hypothetical protein